VTRLPDTVINLTDLVWLIERLEQIQLSPNESARLEQIAVKAGLVAPPDRAKIRPGVKPGYYCNGKRGYNGR
jgi:hypothetical protein